MKPGDCNCDCHKLENVMPCRLCELRHTAVGHLRNALGEHFEAFRSHRADCAKCQSGPPCKEGDSILRTGFPF